MFRGDNSHECTADPAIRELYGCDRPLPLERSLKVAGLALDRCQNYYSDHLFVSRAFRAHRWRELGILRCGGGYAQQPNKFVEVCEYIDYVQSEKTKRESKR